DHLRSRQLDLSRRGTDRLAVERDDHLADRRPDPVDGVGAERVVGGELVRREAPDAGCLAVAQRRQPGEQRRDETVGDRVGFVETHGSRRSDARPGRDERDRRGFEEERRGALRLRARRADPRDDRHLRLEHRARDRNGVDVHRAARVEAHDEHGGAGAVRVPDRVDDERRRRRVEEATHLDNVDSLATGGSPGCGGAGRRDEDADGRGCEHERGGEHAHASGRPSGAARRGRSRSMRSMELAQFCSASRVVIVAGKGGVGKTTVTATLATAAARTGASVLIVEVEGKSGLASAFGCEPLEYADFEVAPGIRARTLTPDQALLEYLEDRGLRRFSRRLTHSGALDVVATAVPGMREILVLGKVKALERSGVADLILIDAPAAGHAIGFLMSPRGLTDAVRIGPVRAQAEDVIEMLSDPERCRVILVTLPEETPVNELVDTAYALEDR